MPYGLSNSIFRRTREHIPESRDFRAHAFRHIVATDIIKNDPKFGFYLASIVLNDHLKTVERSYAHLKTSELYEPYNEYFSKLWNSYKLSDSDPKEGEYGFDGGAADVKR